MPIVARQTCNQLNENITQYNMVVERTIKEEKRGNTKRVKVKLNSNKMK